MAVSRRELIQAGAGGAVALALGPAWLREALAAPARAGSSPYGPLGPADANGLELPSGFSSREIARGLAPVSGTTYVMPIFPDGQATYRTKDGGWILVTNSESIPVTGAGTSAIRFAPSGDIAGAYRILGDTSVNCAGGPTPWGTWLSGEEADDGMIWECDPAGALDAEPRPALGVFKHEAACVDPVRGHVYLTEDTADAGFYRFTPGDYPDLNAGVLEVAAVGARGKVKWLPVPDPTTAQTGTPTRQQVPGMTKFQNGEGIWYWRGVCYWTTKTDKVVWAYDCKTRKIEKLFDRMAAPDSSLDAVDNATVTPTGEVLICEDGGNMEIGLITKDRQVAPLLRFTGPQHDNSEVCGVVFAPSGDRLYFTSQRSFGGPGVVYEVSGPFKKPKGGVPRDFAYGPPAGEERPGGLLNPGGDSNRATVRVTARKKVSRKSYLKRGLALRVRSNEAGVVAVALDTHDLESEPGKGGSTERPKNVTLGRVKGQVERGPSFVNLVVPPPRGRAKRLLARQEDRVTLRLLVSVLDASGNERNAVRRVTLGAEN